MNSRHKWSRRIAATVFSAVLLGCAMSVGRFGFSIGLLGFVLPFVVFGGVNAAAAWAAVGTGTIFRRQLSMSILMASVWSFLAMGSVIGVSYSHYKGFLFEVATVIGTFFLVAQIPFWMLRRSCGFRIAVTDNGQQCTFRIHFKLEDLFVAMLLVAIAATTLRWASPGEQGGLLVRNLLSLGVLLLVGLVFTAPAAVRIAFFDRITDVVLYACCTFTCAWFFGLIGITSVWASYAGPPMSFGHAILIGYQTAILFTTILCPFRVLRATGVRLASQNSNEVQADGETDFERNVDLNSRPE